MAAHPEKTARLMKVGSAEVEQRMLQKVGQRTNPECPRVHVNAGRNNRSVAQDPKDAETNTQGNVRTKTKNRQTDGALLEADKKKPLGLLDQMSATMGDVEAILEHLETDTQGNVRTETKNRQTDSVESNIPEDSDDKNSCGRLIDVMYLITFGIVLSIFIVPIGVAVVVFSAILTAVFSLVFLCRIIYNIISNMRKRWGSYNCDGFQDGVNDCKKSFSHWEKKLLKFLKRCGKKIDQFIDFIWCADKNETVYCAEILSPKIACVISGLVCFIGIMCASVVLIIIFLPVKIMVLGCFRLWRLFKR